MSIRTWILKQFGGVPAEEARGGFEVYAEAVRSNREAAENTLVNSPLDALRMSAVYACVRIISETVASLPLITYERLERGKKRAQDFYIYELLHDRPNSRMTALEYREVIQSHLCLWGNAYSRIVYDGVGRIEELWPLPPKGMMQTEVRAGVKYYQFMDQNGKFNWYSEGEIWHLRGLGDDGERGYSPIALFKRAVELGMSAEDFADRFFKNDARPGIVLAHPSTLTDEAHQRMSDSWDEAHKGTKNAHKPAILEEGVTLHEVGIPQKDAQFLETRKFQVEDIARIYRVPPHMLADLSRATFSNIEHQSIDFVMHCIRPWLVRWEQSISQNLMLPDERKRYFAEHLVDGLLRGDIKTRYESYTLGRNGGWLSVNDIRELENMNPVDGGDTYLEPLNMVPLGSQDQENQDDENDGGEDDQEDQEDE